MSPDARDDLFRLDGQAALITGGGRGLGRAMTLALARAGADCVIVARRKDDLAETERQVQALGRRCFPVPGDVTDPKVAEHAVETAVRECGRLDVLVNNAGALTMGPIDETELDVWQRVLDVNLTGTFLFSRAAAKVFKAQQSGKIINVSSVLGRLGVPEASAYCTAKGGVILFTRSLGAELAPHGIHVNAIAPGLFDTDMSKGVFENEEAYAAVMSGVPRGVHGVPGDLDGTVVYLASRASDHMVGQTLHIDGGSSIT